MYGNYTESDDTLDDPSDDSGEYEPVTREITQKLSKQKRGATYRKKVTWECDVCGYNNSGHHLQCDMCTAIRSGSSVSNAIELDTDEVTQLTLIY